MAPRFIRFSEVNQPKTEKSPARKQPPLDSFYGEEAIQMLTRHGHNISGLPGKILYYLPKRSPLNFRHFIDLLRDMSGSEFEFWVVERFRRELGLDTVLTRSSGDKGCDAVVFYPTPTGEKRMIVSAKQYSDKVNVRQLIELIKKTREYWKPDAYMLITTNEVTGGVSDLQEILSNLEEDVLLVDATIISTPEKWPKPKNISLGNTTNHPKPFSNSPATPSGTPRFKRFGET